MQALEVLVGFVIAGTGFGVIFAVVGRAASDRNRSMSLAIVTAAASAGQGVGAPVAEGLLGVMPWQGGFVVFAGMILAVLLAVPLMLAPAAPSADLTESRRRILGRGARPVLSLIFIGSDFCGYQLAFVTAHFPAFVTELCGPIAPGGMLHGLGVTTTSALGAVGISLIGLFNIAATLAAGWLGNHVPKKNLLAGIHTARTLAAAVFVLPPITPARVLVFWVVMGAVWLAVVPLTSGLIADLYGLRYMGTLYGIIFFSHQWGGFLGVRLGGRMYDLHRDHTLAWWIGVGVGALSALVHLPVRENRATPVRA